jgi:hypothetical protein
MIIGCIVGTRFTLKNIKSRQSYLIPGMIVSLGGSVLAGISFTMFDWIVYSTPPIFLLVLELYLIEAIIIGLVLGGLVGGYYNYRHKAPTQSSSIDDDFYESLKEQ